MKPGDHPDFYRLAPPPGASRDSTIRLDREGRFFHDGALVEHRALADALHTWVSVHPDDGRYILTNGYDWCYFQVEDTAWFVVGVEGEPPAAPVLVLSSQAREPLDPKTLRLAADGVCVALVKATTSNLHRARFTRHAQLALAPWLGGDPNAPSVEVLGAAYPIQAEPAAQ